VNSQIEKAFSFIKIPCSAIDRLSKAIAIPAIEGVLVPSNGKLDQKNKIEWEIRSKTLEILGEIICLYNNIDDSVTIYPDETCSPNSDTVEAIKTLGIWAHNTLWPSKVRVANSQLNLMLDKESNFVKDDSDYVFIKTPELSMETILTAGPSISERECYYAMDAVRYGWNQKWSEYLNRFEKSFADYVDRNHALATSCCTGALHIALAALKIGAGDEVIVPDITWVATANAVLYVGATPIFVDVEKDSWCLDPNSFESCITTKTKAVIPVHLYGHPCNMDPIMEIAQRHGLYVVEDAAPSIGAEYKGKRTGSFGHFAAFSFQGAKLAVTGEGGMLVTSDRDLYEKARQIWDQGRKPGTFWIEKNGLKYKMSNIQAAIGLGQIERNNSMVEAKRRIFSWYEENLKDVLCVSLNKEMPWARSIYWMTSLRLHEDAPLTRDALIASLKEQNIDSRPVFPAISQYLIWPVKQKPQPVAKLIGDHAINLPSGVCLSRREVEYICACIRKALIC